MDLGLTGKVVVVGGSTSGIGRAIALAFAREGARVVLCGRDPDRVRAVSAELGEAAGVPVDGLAVDLTDGASVQGFAGRVLSAHGTVHVLVNNCGGPPPSTSMSLTDEDWHAGLDLVLLSAVRLTRAFLPAMRAQRWGRIINIESFSVKQPLQRLALSNSLRLAVVGWAKNLSAEVAGDAVLVNTVCPGWTLTDRVRAVLEARANAEGRSFDTVQSETVGGVPLRRFAAPEEIANVVAFLGSERASYMTGTVTLVDGGATQTPL